MTSDSLPEPAAEPGRGEATGADAMTTRLAELDMVPLVLHADIYAALHADLQGALDDIDGG
jgi:hypothetical protein